MGIFQSAQKIKINQGENIYSLNLSDETASLIQYDKSEAETILIPSYIDHENKRYYITSIDSTVFSGRMDIKTIEFPSESKLQIIGENTFYNSTIERILIPSSVIELKHGSFAECSNLKNVEFEKDSQLQKMENFVFSSCAIENITIPSNVIEIGDFVFQQCTQLKTIEIQSDSKIQKIGQKVFEGTLIESISLPSNFELENGLVFGSDKIKEIKIFQRGEKNIDFVENKFLVGKENKKQDNFDVLFFVSPEIDSFTIPSYITVIGPYCFNNKPFKNIVIPNQITCIKKNAFRGCSNLKNVEFQKNSNLKKIGQFAFAESLIQSISIPESVTVIEKDAFCFCRFLKCIVFPENSNLQVLDDISFSSKFKSLFVPKNVNKISYFKGLKIIEFESNSLIKTINNESFYRSQDTILLIPQGKSKIPKFKFDFLPITYGW